MRHNLFYTRIYKGNCGKTELEARITNLQLTEIEHRHFFCRFLYHIIREKIEKNAYFIFDHDMI